MKLSKKGVSTDIVIASLDIRSGSETFKSELRIVQSDGGKTISRSEKLTSKSGTYEISYENQAVEMKVNGKHIFQHNGSNPEIEDLLRLPNGAPPKRSNILSGMAKLVELGSRGFRRKLISDKEIPGITSFEDQKVMSDLNSVFEQVSPGRELLRRVNGMSTHALDPVSGMQERLVIQTKKEIRRA